MNHQYDVQEMKALSGLRYWESRPEYIAEGFEQQTLRALIQLVRTDDTSYRKFISLFGGRGYDPELGQAKMPIRPRGK